MAYSLKRAREATLAPTAEIGHKRLRPMQEGEDAVVAQMSPVTASGGARRLSKVKVLMDDHDDSQDFSLRREDYSKMPPLEDDPQETPLLVARKILLVEEPDITDKMSVSLVKELTGGDPSYAYGIMEMTGGDSMYARKLIDKLWTLPVSFPLTTSQIPPIPPPATGRVPRLHSSTRYAQSATIAALPPALDLPYTPRNPTIQQVVETLDFPRVPLYHGIAERWAAADYDGDEVPFTG